jgi:PadR family transcriptional regulator PadR
MTQERLRPERGGGADRRAAAAPSESERGWGGAPRALKKRWLVPSNIGRRQTVYVLQCSQMTEVYLGELEQIVLLAVLRVGDEAYAIPILEQIEAQTGRKIARGALYTALDRLEAKGCLRSRVGEPLPERGGRARRYFTVTPAAVRALRQSKQALMRLWRGLDSILER